MFLSRLNGNIVLVPGTPAHTRTPAHAHGKSLKASKANAKAKETETKREKEKMVTEIYCTIYIVVTYQKTGTNERTNGQRLPQQPTKL